MKTILYLLLCLFGGSVLVAQSLDPPLFRNQLTLTIGGNQGYLKDRNFSPFNHASGGWRFGLGYQRSTRNGDRWNAEIGLGLLNLKANGAVWPRGDRYLLDLALGYRKGLSGNTDERQLHVGGNYRSYVDITLFDDAEAITFFGLHGFEFAVDGSWKTGAGHRLRAAAALPVFALLARPPYTGWDKFIVDNSNNIPKIITRGNWTSLNNFKRLDPLRIFNNQFALRTTLSY